MTYEELSQRIKNEDYNSKLPYPQFREIPAIRAQYATFDNNQKEACRQDNYRLENEFKKDLRNYFETELRAKITDNQFKALFSYAYEEGHSSGYSEILIYANNLLDVVKTFVKEEENR